MSNRDIENCFMDAEVAIEALLTALTHAGSILAVNQVHACHERLTVAWNAHLAERSAEQASGPAPF